MTRFSVSTASTATVDADRQRVWAALTDPDLIVRLTPYLQPHRRDGDRWTWHLVRIPLLGSMVSPSFTEVMTFDEPSRIDFVHDPERTDEKAGVDGRYVLEGGRSGHRREHRAGDHGRAARSRRLARPAVARRMRAVIATMGAAVLPQPGPAPRARSLMRILVLGATGYVGSRLVPALLAAGHEVVAASSSPPDPDRFAWGARGDLAAVRRHGPTRPSTGRSRDADGVCYLVHSLSRRGFADLDRVGAPRRARRRVARPAYAGSSTSPGWCPGSTAARRSRPTWPPGSRSSRCSAEADCSTLSVRARAW